ncbi:Peptidase S46 [Ignavibacterium album JCM 16511]|uniref:Dipeptidyl-peptidase n=1 Tax=Ignavibacterium album (strain DSM 19864 / JCM 16511 / NBRC 101810 / Mat9-16) TaxID=945713 RepID=I0AMX2_IGNAJ|nr:S46 family peptidase [Ignavibacterium album]AFH50329.1 Peptidase S46 [Ignavibacterium album JCM 16511]
MKLRIFLLQIFLLTTSISSAQTFYGFNPDTVKEQKFDMGKMWTFENPPIKYFQEEYGFTPSEEWLEKMQKSALKFGGGCSASFVSEDGLIMTNHHCVRGMLPTVQTENENILKNGFYAKELSEERRVPNLKVEQLLFIKDISKEIQNEMSNGKSDSEKIELRDKKIDELKSKYKQDFPELEFKVISLYNGGKYSLYGYKVYDDVRLVFVPELFVAKLGGDYDNFTYPRYGLDCAFLRAYENDKPVKTNFFFKWNLEGVIEDQPVFVVGNPGRTERINTMAQIEFERDVRYPMMVKMLKDLYKIYEELVTQTNAEDFRLIARLYSIGNALKVYEGTYKGLLDPFLIARKKDFEKQFRNAVTNNKELNEKYGNIWNELAQSRDEARKTANKIFAYSVNGFYSPQYLQIASRLIGIVEDFNSGKISKEKYDSLLTNLYPTDLNHQLQNKLLSVQLKVWKDNLSDDSEIIKRLIGNNSIGGAAGKILAESFLTSKEKFEKLIKMNPDEIIKSNDPFIFFITNTKDELNKMIEENKTRNQREEILNQMLGEALYAVYRDAIPPDATGTLRLADGIVKGYVYNGTRAPIKTTFYGALDRYYSFDKKFPFNLPDYWENLPKDFDLSTPLNFVSTNDIVGGNSGSAVLNMNAEVVGLAFDGNIESLPNDFIYTTEANRTVSVSALGMIEAIRDLYKAEKLGEEILSGKRK